MEDTTRKERILEGILKDKKGLEISPSHRPIAAKAEGYDVEILDRLDQQGLREFYKDHGVDIDAIEPVDYVWSEGSYFDLIGKPEYFDYIIASHLIEHTTNFIGFMQDCSKLLKPEGVLKLVVPDKRYCFDHFRDVTGISEVVNNYYEDNSTQSPGKIAEYILNVVKFKDSIAWTREEMEVVEEEETKPRRHLFKKEEQKALEPVIHYEDFSFIHPYYKVIPKIEKVKNGEYFDMHHYVFTPASFELLLYDLGLLELVDLEIADCSETLGHEFIVTLRHTTGKVEMDEDRRRQMLIERSRENQI